MNCFNPMCGADAVEDAEEYQGTKIRTCKNGHRTVKVSDYEDVTSRFREVAA